VNTIKIFFKNLLPKKKQFVYLQPGLEKAFGKTFLVYKNIVYNEQKNISAIKKKKKK
jgi:hypothetical protein